MRRRRTRSPGCPNDPGSTPGNGPDDEASAQSTPVGGADTAAMVEMVTSFVTMLNGEYVVAIDAPQVTALSDPNSLFVLVASGTEGGPAVDSVLSMVSDSLSGSGGDVTVSTETIDGSTVYTVSTSQDATGVSFSYGVVDGQLLIGLGDSVATYLAGVDSSLARQPAIPADLRRPGPVAGGGLRRLPRSDDAAAAGPDRW